VDGVANKLEVCSAGAGALGAHAEVKKEADILGIQAAAKDSLRRGPS
jgi:hypothetical protein